MAGDERNRKFKVANFIQTDLLQKFISRNNIPDKLENKIPIEEDEEEEEIELSLGLSLNGRFGVDPERAKEIVRASSISNFMIISGEKDSKSWSLYDAALTRTCSLPTETEEEWRKRKELQSLRRMEVKRKRSEKLKNVRVVRERVDLERNCQENGNGEIVIPPIKGDGVVELNGEITPPQFSSQGSIGSQGSGGSSGVSDLESQPIGGTSKYTEERSPVSAPSPIEQTGQKTDKPLEAVVENPPPKIVVVGQEVKEAMKKNMADMPCVSTRGDGPNGRRIEGFLYRYRNGEEVKIVCVCHGNFFSPAEFVKHAGGGDVAHPLRHIVINPAPLL